MPAKIDSAVMPNHLRIQQTGQGQTALRATGDRQVEEQRLTLGGGDGCEWLTIAQNVRSAKQLELYHRGVPLTMR